MKRILNGLVRNKRRLFNAFDSSLVESYSQFGEDVIIDNLLRGRLGITKPYYLDIGAHHPSYLSNTYLFYKNGGLGVCIEPDPDLYKHFKNVRPKDTTVNCGVGSNRNPEQVNFFVFDGEEKGLNTILEDRLRELNIAEGRKPVKKIQITLININTLIDKYCLRDIDFLTVDAEGMDYEILKSLDFDLHPPKVLCVEINSMIDGLVRRNEEFCSFILSKGYFEYANTFINGIFVKNSYEKLCRTGW